MIKKIALMVGIGAAVVLGSALASLVALKNQEDPFGVWDQVDDYDLEQAVIDWENERYEEELREAEEND